MSEEKSLEALKAELEIQKAQLKKLQDQINPPKSEPFQMPRFDPTEGMKMPRSAMEAMVNALPASFYSDLRADAMKPNPVTGGANPGPQPQVKRGSGWRDEVPLGPPPGIEHCDRLMDAQDAKDRAELAMKLAQARLAKGEG